MEFKVGDRVLVTVKETTWLKHLKEAPATIVHIDQQALFVHEFAPIQVELDKAYDEHGQRMLRVSLKELKPMEESTKKEKRLG
jgi:hypothetical protein